MGISVGFGKRVARMRQQRGMSQAWLAERAQVGVELVQLIESGQLVDDSDLSSSLLEKLAAVLQVSSAWLVNGDESLGLEYPVHIVAQRSGRSAVQGELSLQSEEDCPRCGRPAKGSRCKGCGEFLE